MYGGFLQWGSCKIAVSHISDFTILNVCYPQEDNPDFGSHAYLFNFSSVEAVISLSVM